MRRLLVASAILIACGGEGAPQSAPPVAPTASGAGPTPQVKPCEDEYRPAAAPAGEKPELPPIPEIADLPKKNGDAWTVFGATHALRSRFQSAEVTQSDVTIVGWIVDSNVGRAPKCAWHKTGVADPPSCVTEIPSFVIADDKDTKPDDLQQPHIKVVGWARNFAVVFDATNRYKGLKAPPKDLVKDEMWMVDVPYPIPTAGTKVKVKGRYGFLFTKSSTGIVSDPKNGILTYASLEVVP